MKQMVIFPLLLHLHALNIQLGLFHALPLSNWVIGNRIVQRYSVNTPLKCAM